jgi:hypothetical protein
VFDAFGQKLVISTNRGQGTGVRREPCDNCGRVGEPALGEADNSLHFRFTMSTGMTVRTGPTRRKARSVSTGFDGDNVGADSTHPERRSDPWH